MKNILLVVMAIYFMSGLAWAETIVARTTSSYFYKDGKMEKDTANDEITYVIEEDKITRTGVHNKDRKETIPDNTVYYIQSQLSSHKGSLLSGGKPIIRAIGQPGADAIEILVIGEDFVQSCKSTADYFVINRYKINK